ncbi:metallophosphoesterase [Neisseria leonii]|uniref:Metallophosphoesterase n=1 Tax=Neisseria leonii TaxID=2995413 RepID=A0A9X4IE03_9NEIS|nr:metallophosphoesterase [Neisseria sp. 51.81]MDD9328241.1 metallophosphoesterase [Neisseria sp. 51.81]
MKLFIINDLHLGVSRVSGTTRESAAALGAWQAAQFDRLLALAEDATHLLINGDLFDKFDVDKQVEYQTFYRLYTWLGVPGNRHLILSAGNHDLSTNSTRRSSFSNLCLYLRALLPGQVSVVEANETFYGEGFAVVAHHANQELFEEALNKVCETFSDGHCFVHANLMSPFAVHTDHSLNVSREMLDKLAARSITAVFAHEHNARTLDNAVVTGNQIPSSVSDCLDPNPAKQYAVLENGRLTTHDFIRLSDVYAEADWTSDGIPETLFVRLTGPAEYTQAAEVVQRAAEIRRRSSAFIVANGVKTGKVEADGAEEAVKTFDVTALVFDTLPEKYRKLLTEVIAKTEGGTP